MPVRMGNIIRRGTISNEDEAIKDKKMLFLAFKLPYVNQTLWFSNLKGNFIKFH
jgi:hypothetical protein